MFRRAVYLLAALVLAGLGLLATAPAALAHATLESTSPADGAVLRTAPATVSATFDEQVGVSPDSLRVFGPDGQRADNGLTIHASVPQEITVGLLPGLGRGTYTVAWHVVSADSHHVQGAFTFSIGAPSSTVVNLNSVGQPGGSRLTNFTFGVIRGLAFASFAVLIGAVMFVICCWPAGAARPGVLRLAMGGWAGLALATLGAILLQGAYGAGQGLGHVFWPDVLHATLYSRYGRALGVRLVLVVLALIAFSLTLGSLSAASRRARLVAGTVWSMLTIGLATTWAVADHAGTGIQVPLAVPADVVHLTAVAIWTGGLATLVTVVLHRPGPPSASRKERRHYQAVTAEAARAVSRFSPIALTCVIVIVITGTYQAWRGVGLSWGALLDTTYGQLLLVKIGAICALVALGDLARHRVQRLRAPLTAITAAQAIPVKQIARPERATVKAGARSRGNGNHANHGSRQGRAATPTGGTPTGADVPDDEAQLNADQAAVTLRRLRWSVSVEVTIVIIVLTVTAILVNTPTGRETYAPPATASAAFSTGGPQGSGRVTVTVTPAKLGPNQLRLSVTNSKGQPYRPQEVDAVIALPERNLGPLPVKLTAAQTGTYLSAPVIVTLTGQWQLQITIRSDAFDETTVTIPVPVH